MRPILAGTPAREFECNGRGGGGLKAVFIAGGQSTAPLENDPHFVPFDMLLICCLP